jgi:uncharacterized protein (DUF433 family)
MPGKPKDVQLVREVLGDDVYEYYPLGRHVVVAPGVCGGRPTFKGTRVEVGVILNWLKAGRDVDRILAGYPSLTREAVEEAIEIARKALLTQAQRQAA